MGGGRPVCSVIGIYGVHLISYGLELATILPPERAKNLTNPNACDSGNVGARAEPAGGSLRNVSCHNGRGETESGKNLYPKAPDMRQPETQSLTDGELYYIIRNGVRMTGSRIALENGDALARGESIAERLRHEVIEAHARTLARLARIDPQLTVEGPPFPHKNRAAEAAKPLGFSQPSVKNPRRNTYNPRAAIASNTRRG
jgi:hypothetical protein